MRLWINTLIVRHILRRIGCYRTRTVRTGDGSNLVHMLDGQASLDVWPDGAVVVIRKAGDIDHFFECHILKTDRLIDCILKKIEP